MKRSYNWKLWTIVAAIAVFEVLLVFAAVGCEVEESADGGTSKPAPTEVPVLSISAQDLYDAREANATRYDAQYKGKRVRVSGQVVKIDGGDVTLGVDATGFGIDTMGLFGVDLTTSPKRNRYLWTRETRCLPCAKSATTSSVVSA